jgi:hypothetical protein
MKQLVYSSFFLLFSFAPVAGQSNDELELLSQINTFFDALEKQDTSVFADLFIEGAFNHFVIEEKDGVKTGTQSAHTFQFKPDRILKEKLTGHDIVVKIHNRVGMVWAPYNFWVNDQVSHSGIDVFTFFKTDTGWKISSISFSVEPGLFNKKS